MATYSNWREDLIEVIDTPTTDTKDQKKVKEKKINNKIVINPTFKEAVANMGGEIIEMKEIEDKKQENNDNDSEISKEKAKEIKANKEIKAKQKRVGLAKKMILQKKVQAVRAGAGADITASYEPVGPVLEGVMQMIKSVSRKKKQERKPEKAMDAGARARRVLQQKDHEKVNFLPMDEAKVEKGYSDYGKASIRNKRKFGTSGEMPDIMTGKKITKDATRGELIDKRRAEHKAKRGVKEDKAFEFVKNKLKAKYGSGVMTTGEKMKPQSAADKAKARAHQAKVDKENAAERAKDPSQGRYPKG